MNKIIWMYNRLKSMSVIEVIYRIKKAINQKYNKQKFLKDTRIDEILDEKINIDLNNLYYNLKEIFNELDYSKVDLSDIFYIFNEEIRFDSKYEWHKGMKSEWNKSVSSYDIEFKNTDDIGDIRYTWEINRHQYMPHLASLYIKTKDKKYFRQLEGAFEDWIKNNMFLKGVNWSSSMEIALRAYQWLIVLHILKDEQSDSFKVKVSRCILASIDYVMNNLSLYSSANNHLILEAAISSIIGLCFKDVYNQNWFEEGYSILKKEVKNQFHEDGVNKEQALHYQGFVTDMMLQYNSIVKKLEYAPIEEDLISKSVEFMYMLNSKINYVDFGDSDDAKILTISSKKYNYYDYILSFASLYYKKDFSKNYKLYPEIYLFLNEDYRQLQKVNQNYFNVFSRGGYSIINYKRDTLLFDFGEIGFGNLAAHGHADALMVNYYRNNNPIFIDSGTYIYNIESKRRNYYRSTEAHNTLCYANKNQSEIKGPFLWGKKSSSKLLNQCEYEDKIIIEAENDGYSPNIHKRRIIYNKLNKDIEIYDYFQKEAELNFTLDNQIEVEKIHDNILKLRNKEDIFMYCDGEINIIDVKVSKKFMEEIDSKRINIRYAFKSKHLTLISEDINRMLVSISESERR